jgi:hypothetical protein
MSGLQEAETGENRLQQTATGCNSLPKASRLQQVELALMARGLHRHVARGAGGGLPLAAPPRSGCGLGEARNSLHLELSLPGQWPQRLWLTEALFSHGDGHEPLEAWGDVLGEDLIEERKAAPS